MAERQFVAVRLGGGARTYTYHNDGPPVAVGDEITVDTRGGRLATKVLTISNEAPSFPTKPIAGLAGQPKLV